MSDKISSHPCQFAVVNTICGEPATHRYRSVTITMIKGQRHEFSPPTAFYCDRHARWVKHWGGELKAL